uniref:Uncharacterized protein n=1 Tax=Arundo donax TaxID=35708 RepID=A0A0A9FXL5_ARUDO
MLEALVDQFKYLLSFFSVALMFFNLKFASLV